jgi:DNA-binding MarR family transcriptional regulator
MADKRNTLIKNLSETMGAFTRRFWAHKSEKLNHHSFGRSQIQILVMMGHGGKDGATTKELAASLQVTSGAISQMVEPLVADKLVERTEDPTDRRVIRLHLTKNAHKKFGQIQEAKLKALADLVSPLSDTEVEQLIHLLTKVINHQTGDPHADR